MSDQVRTRDRLREFSVLHEAYRRSLLAHLSGDESIDRTLAANDIEPRSFKRICRQAEHDAGVAMNAGNIGWTDVYIAGFLFALELVGRTDRNRILVER